MEPGQAACEAWINAMGSDGADVFVGWKDTPKCEREPWVAVERAIAAPLEAEINRLRALTTRNVMTIKFTSVLDALPAERGKRYLVQTEEGYIHFIEYDPPGNPKPGEPLSWYDSEHDSGYVIAWADLGQLENADWDEHYSRFVAAGDS